MRRRTVWRLVGVLMLLAIVGGTAYVCGKPAVPIRVGMTASEVHEQFGRSGEFGPGWCVEDGSIPTKAGHDRVYYQCKSNDFGFYRVIRVHFDKDDRVIGWEEEVRSLPWRTRWNRTVRSLDELVPGVSY